MARQRSVTTLVEGGMFFESPRWHDGRWYVTDIFRRAIVTLEEDGTDVRDFAVLEQRPSGTGWLPDGSLLVVLRDERRLVRVDRSGTVSRYADLDHLGRGLAGDMVVDRAGRGFVCILGLESSEIERLGNSEFPASGVVARVDPGGDGAVATVAVDGLVTPNGMVISDDGSTLLVGETRGLRYTALAIDPSGALGERRVWAGLDGWPDGCALDADGRVWYADALRSRFVLVAEGGDIVEELPTQDGLTAYACMLGGADGRTLLMCCGRGHPREGEAGQSILLSTSVDVPHAGLP